MGVSYHNAGHWNGGSYDKNIERFLFANLLLGPATSQPIRAMGLQQCIAIRNWRLRSAAAAARGLEMQKAKHDMPA